MPPSKRNPGRRVGWSKLKAGYRKRLEGAGITRAQWEAGADLRRARSHMPEVKGAPKELTERVLRGEGTQADLRDLQSWARSALRPSWIPDSMSADTAAALSLIDLAPGQWAAVHFTPAPDGEPWEMRITPKGAPLRADGTSAYDRVVLIPGGGGAGTPGAREVLDWLWETDIQGEVGETV